MNKKCTECEKNKFVLPYEYFANPLTVVEEGGDWIQGAIKHPGRCTPGSPNYDCPKGSPQWNLAQRFKHGDLHKAQEGGDQQKQIMQVIAMYAKIHNVDPKMIIQKLQQLDENGQQQAIQTMVAEVQQGAGQMQQQQMQQPQQQESAPMSYADNDESQEMESYAYGGGYGARGAVGFGQGIPYINPTINALTSERKGPFGKLLNDASGVLGIFGSTAGALRGFTGLAQGVGNLIKPGSNILQNTNNSLENVIDFSTDLGYNRNRNINNTSNVPVSNIIPANSINYTKINNTDFTKQPQYNGEYDSMVAAYGGVLPQAQVGMETPMIPYSNEYLDNAESDYLKFYNNSDTSLGDGFDGYYHSLIDNLPDVTRKAKGWVEYKPGTEIEEFREDDGTTTATIPGKNRMVKYVEDYEVSDRPNTQEQRRLTTYIRNRAFNKLDNRTVSNNKVYNQRAYGGNIPKAQFGFFVPPNRAPYAQQNNTPDPNEFPQNTTVDASARAQGADAYNQYNNAIRSFGQPFNTDNMTQSELNAFNNNKIKFPKPAIPANEDSTIDESQFAPLQGNNNVPDQYMLDEQQLITEEPNDLYETNPLKKKYIRDARRNNNISNNSFNGMEYAQKSLAGLGAFANTIRSREAEKEQEEYDNWKMRNLNTDAGNAYNTPSFGNYTLNVGPSQNFQPGNTTPIQSGRYGGSMRQSFAQGGEYQVSEDELLQLMQEGAEIEFINK